MSLRFVLIPLLLLLTGCAGLGPTQTAGNIYRLEVVPQVPRASQQRDLTLLVALPDTESGFDTRQIAYTRTPLALDYYTKSEWADTPGRMIAPLVVRALEQSGGLNAVLAAPAPVGGDIRLGLDVIRLQHEFYQEPSQVRLTLRAKLYDNTTRHVLATQLFEEVETAPSEDAYGGVQAANWALARVLEDLTAFVLGNLP
ncbi:MAG: ABC-type transport auxiliary lipoprotein family protein [Candidatus Competibacteraceae bacterium]|nr:ABC-type transport auxiliary lipoprotein family protein [Candidatus Competibacteraceae bacterium]